MLSSTMANKDNKFKYSFIFNMRITLMINPLEQILYKTTLYMPNTS